MAYDARYPDEILNRLKDLIAHFIDFLYEVFFGICCLVSHSDRSLQYP